MAALFGLPLGETLLRFFRPAEPWFAGLFILISGICCNFSHSNAQRGGKLLLVALAITGVTMWVVPEEQIIFGILHFLSVSMLLYAALAPICRRIPVAVGLLVQVFLYLGFRTVSGGTIFFGIKLPDSLYATDWLSPLGLHSTAFHSSDYFPLLPWVLRVLFWGVSRTFSRKRAIPPVFLSVPDPVFCPGGAARSADLCGTSAGDSGCVLADFVADEGRPSVMTNTTLCYVGKKTAGT